MPTPSLGRGSYPCRHRFLACRDKVQVFGVNSAIYIISVVSAGCASAIVMCGRRCPLNGRISLGSSFEISQPCKPPNSALQTSPDSPCEPFQLQSCCDRLLLPRHGIGLHLPPLSDVSRNMAVVDLHLHHAAANLALTVVALVRYGPRHVSSKKRDHTVNMRSLQTRHCTLKAAAIVVL